MNTRRAAAFVFFLSVLFVGFFAWYMFRNMQKAEKESGTINKTLTYLHVFETIMGDMQDLETGERGFIISQQKTYLEPYYKALQHIGEDTAAIKAIPHTADKRENDIQALLGFVQRKIALSDSVVTAVNQGRANQAFIADRQLAGKELMDSIRGIIAAMENEDRPLLRQSNESRRLTAEASSRLFFQLAAVFLVLLLIFFWLADKQIRHRQLAESQLKEKELADMIINSLPGIFYLYDEKGRFIRWNENFETVSGYTADEVSRLHPLDLFDQDEKAILAQRIARVFTTGAADVEAHFFTKDQRKIPYYFNGRKIRYNGKDCLIGVGIDITDKQTAEEKIRQFSERFQLMARATNDAMWDLDLSDNSVWWNDKHYDLYGMNRSQPPGNEDDWKKRIHPEDKDRIVAQFTETIAQQKPFMECEYRFLAANGEYRIVYDRLYAIYKEGALVRMLGTIMDVTDRRMAEEALRLSERKYYLLFENNPLPMWMVSLPGLQIIDVNKSAINHYGYSREEFLNMTTPDLRPAEEVMKFLNHTQQQLTGMRNAGVWRHKKKNGDIIFVDVISHDVVYEGKPVRLVLVNDVTDKLQAEEQLQRSYTEIRELTKHLQDIREQERIAIAREIHDELGQQLTVLKMDVSWVKKRLTAGDEVIAAKMEEMTELLNETVKTVRRIASELRPSILDDLGLAAAIEWQLKEFEKRTEISTEFYGTESEPALQKDVKTSIFRILQESLTNVARHAQAGKVAVKLFCKDGQLLLNIEDDGKGFDHEGILTKKTLGLLGMRERTAMIGGTYEVKSKPGEGTKITVSIPV
ncbi:MAG TPA: PAS domain S-box protein [Chitinophagaceae bacterium]|nr:PAS domain S-box protein [Chitinophagaceae bacterium]